MVFEGNLCATGGRGHGLLGRKREDA
jgi:hypothetical protein